MSFHSPGLSAVFVPFVCVCVFFFLFPCVNAKIPPFYHTVIVIPGPSVGLRFKVGYGIFFYFPPTPTPKAVGFRFMDPVSFLPVP